MSERNPLSIDTNRPPRNIQSDVQQDSASNSSAKPPSQSHSKPSSPAKSPRKKKAKTDKSVFIASHFDSNNHCLAPMFTWQNNEWEQSRCTAAIQSISHRKEHLILKHPIVKRYLYEELDEKHATDDDEQRESQPTSKLKSINPSTIPLNEAQALAWADCSLPYNIMTRESFQTFLESYRSNTQAALTRKEIPIEQQKLALAKRAKIMQALAARSKFRPVTIATDGTELDFSKRKQITMLVNEKASASNQRPVQSPDATRILFEPIRCWEELLLSEPQFARCAAAFLSLSASEAAVERAFSLQKLTHSIIRNRLSEKSVENEMFLKMYHRTFGHDESISIVDQTWKLGAWIEFDDDAVDDDAVDDDDENERFDDEDQSIESTMEEENLMRDNDHV